MKATQITHLFGISGEVEMLALRTLANEVQEANKLAEDFDDDGCNDDEEDDFDEHNYLTSVAEGAGYEFDQDGI